MKYLLRIDLVMFRKLWILDPNDDSYQKKIFSEYYSKLEFLDFYEVKKEIMDSLSWTL
jgi:hypothetical protein